MPTYDNSAPHRRSNERKIGSNSIESDRIERTIEGCGIHILYYIIIYKKLEYIVRLNRSKTEITIKIKIKIKIKII
jgi:hypothetical protein